MAFDQGMRGYLVRVRADCDLQSVAEQLVSLGFIVDHRLRRSHTLTGRARPGLEGRLREVFGVKAVQPEGTVSLPPFDPDFPQ
jgi:hypothetical protein